MMQSYIGVKIIEAEQGLSQKVMGKHPAGSDGYYVCYPDGYESWSPKAVFEEAYRLTSGMTFGLAIEALKLGKKVARSGWIGKGSFLYYVPAKSYPAQTDIAKSEFGDWVPYCAYIAIKKWIGNVEPWNPSTTEILAEDWQIID